MADETQTVHSFCPLDCPDACSLEVRLEGGRVVKLDGDHRNPVTAGFICTKVRHLPEHLYGEERLLHPAVRDGAKGSGRFRRVSWDQALQRVAERLAAVKERSGGEAILPFSYGGSNGLLTQDTTDARLFYRLGSSRLARTVCAAPSGRADSGLYGKMPGVAYADYEAARLIVVWGANPSVSHIHLVPFIRRAQEAGAKLVVVDPRRIPLARQADLHLAPRPGTDLPLALALVRWLFDSGAADEEFLAAHATGADELRRRAAPWSLERAAEVAGIGAADLERFARLYADSSPAVVRCGWGIERNRNGGSAVAAVLALPAVAGKFGRRGGGYTLSNSSAWGLEAGGAAAAEPPATRVVNMNRLGPMLTGEADPPIELLFVYNSNPLATLPEQEKVRAGLERADLFTVVLDPLWTDTARYADVVLPATAFLEHAELHKGYGSFVLQQAPAVATPAGEARPNYVVFAELVRRLGLEEEGDGELATPDQLARATLERHADGQELARQLASDGIAHAFGADGRGPVQMIDVFPRTADSKIHLCPEALDREAPHGLYGFQDDPATDAYPLALISPATNKTISSSLGQLVDGQVAVAIHPDDAGARGIADGDTVRLHNELGEVRCAARLSRELRPGVVYLPKGLWRRHTSSGTTANALVPATLADLAGGACFNDARVEVERA